MGISQQKISYAVGIAAWGSKSQQEGIPILDHVEPEPVYDGTSSGAQAKNSPLPDGEGFRIGPIYYTLDIPIVCSPAHSVLFLDKFFEGAAAGGSPDYDRIYVPSDILPEPASPFLNFWKRTAKEGHDHNLCLYNGLVTGISLSKKVGLPLVLTARCAFADRSFAEANPNHWSINRTSGNVTPVGDGQMYTFLAIPGSSYTQYAATEINLALSCDFKPHFWGTQKADRWSRGRITLSGDLTLRDKTNEVETFSGWIESSSTRSIEIILGNYFDLMLTANFHAGGGSEDEITRQGKFNFAGVYNSSADALEGFSLGVVPGRPYTP